MRDRYNRQPDYLRLSVTDKCNLRCRYCMPHGVACRLQHKDVLSFEETERLLGILVSLGIKKVRITGGEPLVRRGVTSLIKHIREMQGIEHISLTTNGVLLLEKLPALMDAGIDDINISLDTLDREIFRSITGSDELPRVLAGMDRAYEAGIPLKINCVPIRGINDREMADIAAIARDRRIDVRFIELMPLGEGAGYKGVMQSEIMKQIEKSWGRMIPCEDAGICRGVNDSGNRGGTNNAESSSTEGNTDNTNSVENAGTEGNTDSANSVENAGTAGNTDSANSVENVGTAGNTDSANSVENAETAGNKGTGEGPAVYYNIEGFKGRIGFISPISHRFCESCNRLRLTHEGFLKLCLYHKDGVDLRTPMREGADDDTLRAMIDDAVTAKPREHGFTDNTADIEKRSMNEIGG